MALPRSVLLIITGSVAAYKSLELIRLLRGQGVAVTAILTKGGSKFITPLAVSSLTGSKTYDDLFSLTDEVEMGHIELSRSADVVLVAPASADILAKMAAGIADDLATTALLATNKPVIVAPAMNHKMWSHPATGRNLAQLRADGVQVIEPTEGPMACGETGIGRLAEPQAILECLEKPAGFWVAGSNDSMAPAPSTQNPAPLLDRHAIVTAGGTREPIDPVRYLGNRSSGRQGFAIAAALRDAGARVTLIHGACDLAPPSGVTLVAAETAEAMLEAAQRALPADIFIAAAAVADWKPASMSEQKIKKQPKLDTLNLAFLPTVDVLAAIAQDARRPALVIGFAAETEALLANADAKRSAKRADWLLANDVAGGTVFGAEENEVTLLREGNATAWPRMRKQAVAQRLVEEITAYFTSRAPQSKPSKGHAA